ncbi:MAG: hypothetical protein E7A50_07565 [Clostridiales bacterium]|nr:hypothetical protein [Clostridiales bacterium]
MPDFKIVDADGELVESSLGTHNRKELGDGNGGGGNMLEEKVAKLESDVGYIRRDVDELKMDLKSISSNMTTALERLSSIKESLANKPSSDAVDKKIAEAKVSQIIWTIGSVLTIVSIASGIVIKILHV